MLSRSLFFGFRTSRSAARIVPSWVTLLMLLMWLPGIASARGQDVPAAAGRFIVIYRDGLIPGNAAAGPARLGAHLVERQDLLGLSVVDSLSGDARAELARDPAIEAIVPDVILKAHALTTRPWSGPWSGPFRRPRPGPVSYQPHVLVVAPDAIYHSPQGWAVRQVGGFGADGSSSAPTGPWNVTKGEGVRIAILDSGVDPNHPDIAPNLVLNLSEIKASALPSACDDASPLDQQGHGTWTASLAAGALGPQTGLVAGVAPAASILNIKVLQRMPGVKSSADPTGCIDGQGAGLLSWVIQGIADAVANRADVISMSLGTLVDITSGDGAGQQTIFNRATQAAYNAGVVLIAAAGNDAYDLNNQRLVELPAQSRNVLAIVASTNPACAQNLQAGAACAAGPVSLPYYSNFGASLNALAAPGGSYPAGGPTSPSASVSVASGWVTGACSSGVASTLSGVPSDAAHSFGCFNLGHAAYVQAMGTSAAAPLVAGAAALLRAAHPSWTPAAVIQALRASASPATSALPAPQVSVASLLSSATN